MAVAGENKLLAGRQLQLAGSDWASGLAAALLTELGAEVAATESTRSPEDELRAWQDSGLSRISLRPAASVSLASSADAAIQAVNALLARPKVALKGRRLLGMRGLSHPLQMAGQASANRSCRLLATQDGSLAVNLAREEDWHMLPAWLQCEELADWQQLTAALCQWPQAEALQRARLLGLAVAPLQPAYTQDWAVVERVSMPVAAPSSRPLRVLDMSNLWAGPLCALVLQQCGAQITRLVNPQRPDGALSGPPAFFQALHPQQASIAIDLQQPAGRQQFLQQLATTDLVIESARPRGLQQLGLHAQDLLRAYPGLSWLSITGYGRALPQGEWVAFGDDAAVAGGLAHAMAQQHGQPAFCGDAIADPLTGLHAALLALAAMQAGGGYLLSVALSDVVSSVILRGSRED